MAMGKQDVFATLPMCFWICICVALRKSIYQCDAMRRKTKHIIIRWQSHHELGGKGEMGPGERRERERGSDV